MSNKPCVKVYLEWFRFKGASKYYRLPILSCLLVVVVILVVVVAVSMLLRICLFNFYFS